MPALHHVDRARLLRELTRQLKPGYRVGMDPSCGTSSCGAGGRCRPTRARTSSSGWRVRIALAGYSYAGSTSPGPLLPVTGWATLAELFKLNIREAAPAAIRHANGCGGADNIMALFVEFLAS